MSGEELFFKWEAKRFEGGKPQGDVSIEGLTMAGVENLKKGIVEDMNRKRLKEQNAQSRKVDVMAMMRRGQKNSSKNPVNKSVAVRVSYKGPSDDMKSRKCEFLCRVLIFRFLHLRRLYS